VRRFGVAIIAVFMVGAGSAAAGARVPTPPVKPDWLAQPVAVQLGLVSPSSLAPHLAAKGAGNAASPLLSPGDRDLYRRAFKAAKRNKWRQARELAARAADPLPAKVVEWMWLGAPGTRAGFERIAAFIAANPDWPGQSRLRRQAEESLSDRIPDERVRAWLAEYPPITGWGRVRLAEALIRGGDRDEGIAMLRRAWAEGDFTRQQSRAVYKRHRKLLRRGDHIARLDRLLWDDRYYGARRMLTLVGRDFRLLAEARLALMRRRGGVDGAIARVPDDLKEDPGLVYERLRWRRRKGFDDRAREILLAPPDNLVRPEKWWDERQVLARRALAKGYVTEAYRIVADHRLTGGRALAEAEWLAGWIALIFLRDSETALGHFSRLYDNVRYPVSRARGAYWAGRAADAGGRARLARTWYGKAERYPTTYYGQLATLRLGRGDRLDLPPTPRPQADERRRFEQRELVRVARLLAEIGADRPLRAMVLRLNALAKTPSEHALVSELAMSLGRPDLAVAAAKRSALKGTVLASYGYPEIPVLAAAQTRLAPLLHAVSRQESEFDPRAVSPRGARGLMQILPGTARRIARSLKIRYSRGRLTADPAYNVRLGSYYLGRLVERYDGSYVLALAAYNAGEGRVRRWLRQWGDPRTGEIDAVDWIELLPFSETRNYLQRVLEGVQVYRQRLPGREMTLTLNDDLRRQAVAPLAAASGCSSC